MEYASLKRGMDILGATVGMLATLPVTVTAAAVLFAQNRGDVFFKQKRVGMGGKEFDILKFKTMTDKCGQDGQLLPNEERVTPFGRFLRKHSIDEMPQFINVLKGDMSLVGPRPLPLAHLFVDRKIAKEVKWLDKYVSARQKTRPGLVSPFVLVPVEEALDWTKRLVHDAQYTRQACFCFDAAMMMQAGKAVLYGRPGTSNNCSHHTMLANFLQEIIVANPRYQTPVLT